MIPRAQISAMIAEAQDRAVGAINLTTPDAHHAASFLKLAALGCDWQADTLPAVEKVAAAFKAKGQLFRSWTLIEEHATTNRDNRLRPQPDARYGPAERERIRKRAWDSVSGEMAVDAQHPAGGAAALEGLRLAGDGIEPQILAVGA